MVYRVLPNLRQVRHDLLAIDVVFISHFHADHTFGWPFLYLDYMFLSRRRTPLWVVGPPGVEAQMAALVTNGCLDYLIAGARRDFGGFPLHFVEVTEQEQEAGGIRFRAVRVDHQPDMECFGYLIEQQGRWLGYSGDTRFCDGLRTLAASADTFVVECSVPHGRTAPSHLNPDDIRQLRREFPHLPFVLTHLSANPEADTDGIAGIRVAHDFERMTV